MKWIWGLVLSVSSTAYAINAEKLLPLPETALRSIVAVQSLDDQYRCSGVIISNRHVITSGHCFDLLSTDPQLVHVHLLGPDAHVDQTLSVNKIYVHPIWLLGRMGINSLNRQLRAFYDGLVKLEHASISACSLKPQNMDWKDLDLQNYFHVGVKFKEKNPVPQTMCERSYTEIVDWLNDHRNLLGARPIDQDEVRDGDLAIVELKTPIEKGSFHRPMEVDFQFDLAASVGRPAFVTGLGLTNTQPEFSWPVNSLHMGLAFFGKMTSVDNFRLDGPAVMCPGDSGGATGYLSGDKLILVALNAGGTGCDYTSNYSVATLLKNYRGWISDIIRN